ncbi:Mediator of RNA polymerase II transcription subunit 7 [Puccinia graminis f. sp. tritici]|uniref:Mediator of RNA polymerase II transcription subunit 7 n=1 Tax=Puccinia graminis f. sp. tritici TaxID=56615 RepID=A0A5B0NQR1_PUCGR|nr:Mediator of RNA polymerase II transcription subunit 7 [Puccinia graminis f. sp. tritici]KAA1090209.1 Mediator of RNA polymerase II transcription subunit 7 [Puccinia graminis f. sp. tritici]
MESNKFNSSFFLPPPLRHRLFTNKNLSLAKQLRADTNNYQEISDQHPFNRSKQTEIVGEGLNEINLRTLIQPPFLDWIRQNKGWNVFGVHEPWLDSSIREASEGYPCLSVSLSLKGE